MPKPDGTPTDEELAAAAGTAPVPAPIDVPGYARVKSFAEHQKQLQEMETASQGYLDPEQQKALFDMKYNEIMGPKDPKLAAEQAAAKEAQLAKTRPDWYKQPIDGPAHPKPGWGALGQGLGAIAAGAQKQADLGAQMPGRWLSLKRQDQAGANLAGIASGIGNYLINKPQQDEQQDLATALKQAQLHRVLNPVPKGGATSKGDEALSLIRANTGAGSLGLSAKARVENAGRQGAAQAMVADEKNADSTVSEAARQGLLEMGADPVKVGHKSSEQLRRDFPWMNREESQEYQTWHTAYGKSLESLEHANRTNQEQAVKQTEKENARNEQIAQQVRDEVEWQPGTVATDDERKKVAGLIKTRSEAIASISRLREINDRLAEKYGAGAIGRGIAWFKANKINLNPEDTQILTEAENIKGALATGSRLAQDMGAPTGSEYEISKRLTDASNSVGGMLNPNEFYQGLLDSINRNTALGIRANRAFLKGTKPLEGTPAPEPKVYNVTPTDYTGGQPAPGSREARPQQPAARSPAPANIPLPTIPMDTSGGLGPNKPVTPVVKPDREAARVATEQGRGGAGGKKNYRVDFHDGQGPQVVPLSPEEVKEATDLKATVEMVGQ